MKEEYVLTQDGRNYDLSLQIVNGNTLRARCHCQSDCCRGEFIGDYTMQELREVNEIFNDFNTLDQVMLEMDEAIVKHLCGVIDDEEMFEVVIYLDLGFKKAKVPLLLEWGGECRLHQGKHTPDIIGQIEKDNSQLRRDQDDLRRLIDNALMDVNKAYSYYEPKYQPYKQQNLYENKYIPQNESLYPENEEPIIPNKPTVLRSKKPQPIQPRTMSYNSKKLPNDDDNDFDLPKPVYQSQPQYHGVNNIDSRISSFNELDFVLKKISHYRRINLLYRATRDGDKAHTFHALCDKARSSLVLIQTTNGKRFGGYTTRDWAGDCEDKKDFEAFVFSLDKMSIYDVIPDKPAIGAYPEFGPIFFGCQIKIYDSFFSVGGSTYKRQRNYQTLEDYELNGGSQKFNIVELEVFEVD